MSTSPGQPIGDGHEPQANWPGNADSTGVDRGSLIGL